MPWEIVVGLETHVELSTETKIFCSCSTAFGGAPNTRCCPVCTGQPGSLPVLNKKVVELAALAGLALDCRINSRSDMARKHYVYPDLPKAYQISQFDKPLCEGGYVGLSGGKKIRITRIHIEEDAGKLVHTEDAVLMDYNRGGVPLIEIVSEPDIRSSGEAVEYLEKLQYTLRALGVSDCRMQEGSLRCDVNISLRRSGEETFGTRAEIKNLNSFTSVAAAIEYEYGRQKRVLESGGEIVQETRNWDADKSETVSSRSKEDLSDYRYFPEPDIGTVYISEEELEKLKDSIPELPEEKLKRYVSVLGVPEADAKLLTKYKKVSDYFETIINCGGSPKTTAALMVTQMFSIITTEVSREQWSPKTTAEQLNSLVQLIDSGKLSRNIAKRVISQMLETGQSAEDFITEDDLAEFSAESLTVLCREAVSQNPKSVSDYRAGKVKAVKALVGAVMRASRGRADASEAEKTLIQIIEELDNDNRAVE